jgi:lysine/ornithine N-monooxygenase
VRGVGFAGFSIWEDDKSRSCFPTVAIQVRVARSGVYRVALEPSCGARVVLAGADMVQHGEGDILVPLRAVPQKRLLNPLGGHTEDVAPAVVVPRFGNRPVRRD